MSYEHRTRELVEFVVAEAVANERRRLARIIARSPGVSAAELARRIELFDDDGEAEAACEVCGGSSAREEESCASCGGTGKQQQTVWP